MVATNQCWSKLEDYVLYKHASFGPNFSSSVHKILPHRTRSAIRSRARLLGLKISNKRWTVNDDYFGKPTLENCYWAGFIAADGYVRTSSAGSGLHIGLKRTDEHHLHLFSKTIGYYGPVRHRTHFPGNKPSYTSSISIYSKKLTLDLGDKFNIFQSKSLTLLPPNLDFFPLSYSLAFIVGLFDGDGSCGWYGYNGKKPQFRTGIISTFAMLNWVKDLIDILKIGRRSDILPKNKLFTLTYYGVNAERIHKTLSSLEVPKLMRKWGQIERRTEPDTEGEESSGSNS